MSCTQPILTHINTFTVSGLSVRTINSDEFNQATAKLPNLWDRFLSSNMADKVPNRLLNSPVYGVYSDYESDASGFYTVTAGVTVSTALTRPELNTVEIQTGYYLVFAGKGMLPQAVIETWGEIWAYFKLNTAHKRNFITDFEIYLGSDEIAIYIGVVK